MSGGIVAWVGIRVSVQCSESDQGVSVDNVAWVVIRGGDPSAVATPLGDASGGSEASELLID